MDDEAILTQLRDITKQRKSWGVKIDEVASILGEDYSSKVMAKALWLLGEMGLKHTDEISDYVADITVYMGSGDSKLRERSANALGRIGRGDVSLVADYIDSLMELRFDTDENVRHAFIWACENIATNNPEMFCDNLDIFFDMISDSSDKVKIEAPEMFRVVGKTKPECVIPYLVRLEEISQNDANRVVRIHSAGALKATRKALGEM
jgi:HEAT repeat protein